MTIFKECNSYSYSQRTEMNICNSDITIAIAKNFYTAGEAITKRLCEKHNKLYIPLTFEDACNEKKIFDISNQISNYCKFSMPMFFVDGINGQMSEEYRGKSTIDLIIEKLRFATSRKNFPNINVGDIIRFYDFKNKEVFVRVIKKPYSLNNILTNRTYSGSIDTLKENQIFVFGSNTKGIHGAGSAKKAVKFGAIYGQAKGRQGNTYAIVTKDLDIGKRSIQPAEIIDQIYWLYKYAKENKELEFLIAYKNDNNNLNGYTSNEMAKFFIFAIAMLNLEIPENIIFENSFLDLMKAEYWSLLECWNYERYFEIKDNKQITFTTLTNRKINFAGNGIYTLNSFNISQDDCDKIVYNFIKSLNLTNIEILSGGQTGVDESAIKAANAIGLKSKIYATKGWKFRDKTGKDIYDEIQFKQRFITQKKN